ncbi:glycosyltransferase family 2 protein [uncultured Lamprocystis sp.]|jgi:hypothetical protein|uniref:glycosyltransferase family 2 protein n=1 Tax=uncultured Lamprocystis sp. TaxID=543132 RepID=UPI0025DCBF84|nr:glycosyltransferase family 2 protein [uncultured Lamprocystis sp.]
MRSSVLFLVFNRPDTTALVFDAIRAARPPRLYIAADGPRIDRHDEPFQCEQVRRIATAIEWPCECHMLFRDRNLGCKIGVSEAINWFFANEEEGIILEDDVVPLPGFFPYCDELLERYRMDHRLAMISGTNSISHRFTSSASYYFSRHVQIWGWATWRRAWARYDVTMQAWPAWKEQRGLQSLAHGRVFEYYWRDRFDRTFNGEIDTWDYQWTFACWYHDMLAAVPACNQTLNVGFRQDATHTNTNIPLYVQRSIPQPLRFPLLHPTHIEVTPEADLLVNTEVLGLTVISEVLRRLGEIPVLGQMVRRLKSGFSYISARTK